MSRSTWTKLSFFKLRVLVLSFVVDYRFYIKGKILPQNKNLHITQYTWKNGNNTVNKSYAFKYVGHIILFSFCMVVSYACFCTFYYSSLFCIRKTLIDM